MQPVTRAIGGLLAIGRSWAPVHSPSPGCSGSSLIGKGRLRRPMQLQIHHPTKVSSLILESTHRESNIQLKVEDSPGPNPTCGRWTPWLHRQHPEWTRPAGDSLISGTLLESLSLKSTSGKWPRKLKVVDIQRNLRVTIHCIQRSKNIGVKEDYKR